MRKIILGIVAVIALMGSLDLLVLRSAKVEFVPMSATHVQPFYGFIRGGIKSIGTLKLAMAQDPALASQFAKFDFSKAHFEFTTRTECDYVAYRRRGEFAWTKRCKLIPRGTLVLTDGELRIRAACGNPISSMTEVPTIPNDLEPNALDVPDDPLTPGDPSTLDDPSPNAQPTSDVPVSTVPKEPEPPLSPLPNPPIFCSPTSKPVSVPAGDDAPMLLSTVIILLMTVLYLKF